MKRLFIVVTLAILLLGSVLLGLDDMDISVADTSVPNNELAGSVSSNSFAAATITIMMTGVFDE